MFLLRKMLLIAVTIVASNAMATDRPDSGTFLRESAPPPVTPLKDLPKIQKPPEHKEQPLSGVRVKVSGFTFTGNTIFSSAELSALLANYLGKELTLDELNIAAAKITNAYRARGYFLASAFIPPQTIKADAPILIEVIEGILEGVRLETKPPETRTPRRLLQRYIDQVPTGKPSDEGTLSEMVMRINELPGITSRILLEPGSQKGTSKALLDVTEGAPYSFSIDTDNHGNYSTGYYRFGATLELYSPLHRGDLFMLRVNPSFSGDSNTVQTGYILPISDSGARVGFNYSYVTYVLGKSFEPLDASGDAHDFILTLSQPLIRSRSLILNLTFAGEGKILDDRTGSPNETNKRHTITGQAGVSGVEMDSWFGGGSTSFSLSYIGGYLNIDDALTLTNDKLHTDGSYNKLLMSISRNQNIYKNLTFYTGINGQWASNNLDSAEQFSLGGPNAVRAFPVSEASGDMGFVYTGELRYLIGHLGAIPGSIQLAAFVDHGHAVIHDDPVVSDNTRNLTGAGFGISWFEPEGMGLHTSIAWRTAGTATGKSETTDPTIYFQAVKRF